MQKEKIIGINPVMEALRSGRPIQRLLIAEQRKQGHCEIIRLQAGRGRGQDGVTRRAEP
jgi:tRNA G18 (ribose-2'-O)-methylase SpoU